MYMNHLNNLKNFFIIARIVNKTTHIVYRMITVAFGSLHHNCKSGIVEQKIKKKVQESY